MTLFIQTGTELESERYFNSVRNKCSLAWSLKVDKNIRNKYILCNLA